MTNHKTTADVLSTIGTVIWCIQLSPQIYFLHRKKDAEGFPPLFMLLWCVSGVFMCLYFIISNSYIPMQIQPHLFTILCSIAWIQSMYYPPNSYKTKRLILIAGNFYLSWIGLELGFAIWLRKVYSDGTKWPDLIFGIIATVFLSVGLFPPYFELFKRKGRVVGINFLFLFLDSTGAIFSMASMLIDTFDPMGMSLYVVMIALEVGMFVSQGIWWLRFRWRKKGDLEEGEETEREDLEEEGEDEGDGKEQEENEENIEKDSINHDQVNEKNIY